MTIRMAQLFLRIGVSAALTFTQIAQAAVPPGDAAGRIRPVIAALDAVTQSAPRDRFDIAAAATGLTSAENVRDWIGRETVLVSYAGLLRDAAGVLEDRRGNALDRSLLQLALLKQIGLEGRLARATLTDAQAEALLATTGAPPASAPVAAAFDPALFTDAGIPAADVAKAAEAQETANLAAQQEREARLGIQPGRLTELAGSAPADLAATERAAALAALKDHWWVQVKTGEDWIDSDPAAAVLGAPLTPAATMAADAVPADLNHSVTIRVVAETVSNRAPAETVLLSKTVAAAAAAVAPLTLGFEGGGIALAAGADGAALLAAGVKAPAWLPRLSVAGEQVADKGVLLTGEVRDQSDPIFAVDTMVGDAVASGVGGAIDAIGGMGEPPPATGLLTAMWLEVEIAGPGVPAAKERRMIFDAVGPAARASRSYPGELSADRQTERAAALMGMIDLIVQTAATSADRSAYLSTVGLRDSLTLVAAVLDAAARKQSLPEMKDVVRVPVPLYVYGTARFLTGAEVFIDRPNVAALHATQIVVDGELTQKLALDVIFNRVGVVQGADPFVARIAQGVRDTVAEDQAFGFPEDSANASARFADYEAAGIALAPLGGNSLPADPAALAAQHVAAGYLVFAPARPLDAREAAIWWRIDPRTGETLGFGPNGYGSTTAEQVSILVNIQLRLVGAFVCITRLATAQVGGNTCGMVAGGLCLAGAMLATLGVAAKALGEMGTLTAQWVGNAGIAAGLAGTGAGELCR